MVGCCISDGWSEDMALLGGAYALSLLSTWLCHKVRPRTAFGNHKNQVAKRHIEFQSCLQ